MALGTSSEEGAVAATGLGVCLVDEVEVVDFPFLATSASVTDNVLYPFPEGKLVGQSQDQWPT